MWIRETNSTVATLAAVIALWPIPGFYSLISAGVGVGGAWFTCLEVLGRIFQSAQGGPNSAAVGVSGKTPTNFHGNRVRLTLRAEDFPHVTAAWGKDSASEGMGGTDGLCSPAGLPTLTIPAQPFQSMERGRSDWQ